MTIEEFVSQKLAIAEDKQSEAVTELKAYLDGEYVTKSRFNTVNEEKQTLSEQIAERDTQLKEIKKNTGDNEELKKQIETLQTTNKEQQKQANDKIKALQLSSAIKIAIADSAQDADIVSGLFDESKLILGEDGKVTGLDEQLTALKASKPFLFKSSAPGGKGDYKPNGGQGGSTVTNPFAKDTFNLTEQGKLLRDSPEQARAMATEAGVKI
jgi:myosin heavy subunit